MRFWVSWSLWQKLTFALGVLLGMVLVYAFIILAYNRRKVKKYAAEEAAQQAERAAEMRPILTDVNEIPFGAKALEKGIEVEGIWNPKRISISKQPSRVERLGAILGQKLVGTTTKKPDQTHLAVCDSSTIDAKEIPESTKSNSVESVELEGVHIDTFRASRPPKLDLYPQISKDVAEKERPRSRGWVGSRSSWITKPFEGHKWMSMHDAKLPGYDRMSSEDFRRRISRLFDESIQSRPAELFQLKSVYPEPVESCDKASLDASNERPAASD